MRCRRFDKRESSCSDLAVASKAQSNGSIGVGQLDPECATVNDCAVDRVLRRHGERGDALRHLLYLFERDEGVRLLAGG